jgi:ketosteroid isomerase-like protein
VASSNLEIVERGFEAFNRDGIEGILPFIHFDLLYEVMDGIRWDARELREVGDRVVVEFTLRARGKTTGLDFGQDAVMVWELRDGQAIRLFLYPTVEQALSEIERESSSQ